MDSIEARQQRWRRFLDPADPGAPPFMFLVRCAADDPPRPPLWPTHWQARCEWAWALYQRQCQRAAWLADDAVPCLSVATGTEIFAEAFGCQVHRPEDNMPFALPSIGSAGQVSSLRVPELSRSSLAGLFDLADALRRRAGPEAVLRLVDIQSPMDIAALIWEKEDFLAALIAAPEAVRELAAKTAALLTAFLDEWFGRYGTRYVAHYPDYFMDGGVTVSEDEVGSVSAAMFAGFFRGELEALSRRYGGLGVHCCAHARHQWPQFKTLPGLRLLNLNQPHPVLAQAYLFFDTGVAQMHYGFERSGPVESWPAHHPAGRRVVYEISASSREEALAAAGRFNAMRERCG
jgi:hypothetical protein